MTRSIKKRIDRIEATRSAEGEMSVAERIIAARKAPRELTQTKAELEVLAKEPGLAGRIASACLRVCLFVR